MDLTLVHLLDRRANENPDHETYTFISRDQDLVLTRSEIVTRARTIAAYISQSGVKAGDSVLLLYPSGPDHIAAFFACLYAGVTAVPIWPPAVNFLKRGLERVLHMVEDADIAHTLTNSDYLKAAKSIRFDQPALDQMNWIATDSLSPLSFSVKRISPDQTAFIQYTSGSTSAPKGVVISHANLIANQEAIRKGFSTHQDDRIVSWLPLHHDMGLIGGLLHPLYTGASCALMPPMDFLRRPLRWLENISKRKATISGAPDFAYTLCARKIPQNKRSHLDLSCWRVAFNGAEPVRSSTLDLFTKEFKDQGFSATSFYPCYGLAEATLFVSGGDRDHAPLQMKFDKDSLERGKPKPGQGSKLVSCGEPHQEVRIVNPESGEVLTEQIGEIWVYGAGVSKGYHKNTPATEFTFLNELQGKQWLRTGDLGFMYRNELFITGRLKDLIIIRGRNLSPNDIEDTATEVLQNPNPNGAAAFSHDHLDEVSLVILIEVAKSEQNQELINQIRERITENHEVNPAAIVFIKPGKLPRTTSGKIKRSAARKAWLAGEFGIKQPEELSNTQITDAKDTISAIQSYAATLLKRPAKDLDPDKSLAALGFDSLASVELQHHIEDTFNIDLPFISAQSSIKNLADHIDQASSSKPIHPGDPIGRHPLTPGQKALWFHSRKNPDSTEYHVAHAVRLPKAINLDALKASLDFWVAHHGIFRTRLGMHQGEPYQEILPQGKLNLIQIDTSNWDQTQLRSWLSEQAHHPFDSEHPWRIYLLNQGENGYILMLAIHHILVDFWSIALLLRDLGLAYKAYLEDRKPYQPKHQMNYCDFVYYHQQFLQSSQGEQAWRWWQEALKNSGDPLRLPSDKPNPKSLSRSGSAQHFQLPSKLIAKLRKIAQTHQTTFFVTLLTLWQALLYRLSGQQNIVTGSPAMGRSHRDFTAVAGYFVNMIPIPGQILPGMGFSNFLEQITDTTRQAFQHQEYPFALLVEKLSPQRHKTWSTIFQAAFAYQSMPPHAPQGMGALALGEDGAVINIDGLELQSVAFQKRTAPFDITLYTVDPEMDKPRFSIEYATERFDSTVIKRYIKYFQNMAEAVCLDPQIPLNRINLIDHQEQRTLLHQWSGHHKPYPSQSVDQLFEEQVLKSPKSTAVVGFSHTISYQQLNQQANQLARVLIEHGLDREDPVCFVLQRTDPVICLILAILKAGGVYTPLDPSWPQQRITGLIQRIKPKLIINNLEIDSRTETLKLKELLAEATSKSSQNLNLPTHPQQLAYIMQTSGSTGRPKLIGITHQAIARLIFNTHLKHANQSTLLLSPLSFDASTLEIWAPLLQGGACIIYPHAVPSLDHISDLLTRNPVKFLWLTTALFNLIIDANPTILNSVSHIMTGGEALSPDHVRRAQTALPRTQIYNAYGPTESTTFATMYKTPPIHSDAASVPIGHAIDNTFVYVMNQDGFPQPIGVSGELHLGGDGLARGYLGSPSQTALAFIPNPSPHQPPGSRIYRTGDRVRFRESGLLEFIERLDHQVKIRGFRIEPEEISAVLRSKPEIASALVLCRDEGSGPYLVAYYTQKEKPTLTISQIKDFLFQTLPQYMVPSYFVQLEHMPINANGKVDRAALPTLVQREPEQVIKPVSGLERRIAVLWAELLEIEQPGTTDNFFDLGGHSLLAVKLHDRLQNDLDMEIPLVKLFEFTTIQSQARFIDSNKEPTKPNQASADDRASARRQAMQRKRKTRSRK